MLYCDLFVVTGGGCRFCGSVEHYRRDCPERNSNKNLGNYFCFSFRVLQVFLCLKTQQTVLYGAFSYRVKDFLAVLVVPNYVNWASLRCT